MLTAVFGHVAPGRRPRRCGNVLQLKPPAVETRDAHSDSPMLSEAAAFGVVLHVHVPRKGDVRRGSSVHALNVCLRKARRLLS